MSFYNKVLADLDENNVSLSTINRSHTARDLRGFISRYENMLSPFELEGKRVALLVNSVKEYLTLFFAINKLKGTPVPLSLQFRNDDLISVLDSLDPHIILTVNETAGFSFSTVMKKWAKSRDTKTTIFTTEDYNDWQENTFGKDIKPLSSFSGGFITFTSGSTGKPKGIVFADSIFEHTFNGLSSSMQLKPTDNLFVYSATSTFYAATSMTTALKAGANVVVIDEFDVLKILDLMEKAKCNKFTTTPSIFKSIYNFGSNLKPEVFKRLELVCVAGEKVTPSFINNFPLMENCILVSHYGSSEMGSIAEGYIGGHNEELELTIVNGVKHKVVDGELFLKTEGMFSEYYNNNSLTKQAFEHGWFKTGDLVEFIADKTFKIVGRKKDVIKKGGLQVVSSEVENYIQSMEGVKNVAVIGAPHDVFGEQVVAFVVSDGVTAKDIRSYCTGRISSYKIPDKILILDELPLTHGKVDKVKLRSVL